MSLSKQDMKHLANGKVVTEEALIAIVAAKRDDFERWCEARQFQHFLMRARLGSPSDPMTLPRLQKWAADEMFHLRVSLSSGVQRTPASIYVQSLEENQRAQCRTVKSGGSAPGNQTPAAKAAASQPKVLKMFEIDDLLNGDYTNEVVARITQRDIEIIVGQRAEPHVAWFLRDLLGIRRDHSDFTARRLVRDWVYDIKSRETRRECMKTQDAEEPIKHQTHIDGRPKLS